MRGMCFVSKYDLKVCLLDLFLCIVFKHEWKERTEMEMQSDDSKIRCLFFVISMMGIWYKFKYGQNSRANSEQLNPV